MKNSKIEELKKDITKLEYKIVEYGKLSNSADSRGLHDVASIYRKTQEGLNDILINKQEELEKLEEEEEEDSLGKMPNNVINRLVNLICNDLNNYIEDLPTNIDFTAFDIVKICNRVLDNSIQYWFNEE